MLFIRKVYAWLKTNFYFNATLAIKDVFLHKILSYVSQANEINPTILI